ncbi:MAG TPA: hypothetical protein VFC41_08075 [Anaerovoracaceae bacterium]|nr:hypothetical protein [Anaerovoracaceae bacterium]
MSPQQKESKNDIQRMLHAPPHRRCQGRVLGSDKMKAQTKHFAECVFKDGMKGLEAQSKLNLRGLGYEC